MNDSAKISVCIPFYNLENYASRCLTSVLNNTYKNLEVICVNDGSSDKTLEVLRKYERSDPRLIVIDKPNGGVISARNAAINAATGDFIAFIDGDDWIHRQYFESLLLVQRKTNADVVVCDYVRCTEIEKESLIDLNQINYQIKSLTCVLNDERIRSLVWGRLFSRELVFPIKGATGISLGEDTIFNLSFLCNKQNSMIAVLYEKFYYYYQREGSLAHAIPHQCRIKVSRFFMDHFSKITGVQEQNIVLHEIARNIAAYRYLQMFSSDQAEIRVNCQELYNFCKTHWEGIFSLRYKMKYSILYYCPAVYRLFRIVTDPTMLDWERAERKRQLKRKQG